MSVPDYSLPRVVHHRADLWRTTVDQLVHLVAERRFTPPRLVEVERDGYWWPGFQHAWRLCDDGRGWMAAVEYVVIYDWGRGKHLDCVPPGRVRLLVTPQRGRHKRTCRWGPRWAITHGVMAPMAYLAPRLTGCARSDH